MSSRNRPKFSRSVALIWIGIIIPVLVGVLPFGIRYVFPEVELLYRYVGPVSAHGIYAFTLAIENSGRNAQHDVEVWIPYDDVSSSVQSLDESRHFAFEASSPASVSTSEDKQFKIIGITAIRPSETVTLSMVMGGHGIYVHDFTLEKLRIVSPDTVAAYDDPDDFFAYLTQFGAFMFLFIMLVIGIYGVYYTYFMDPRKKEEMILKEIEKL